MLSRRMQIQKIADWLAGNETERRQLSNFEEPWRSCYAAVVSAPREKRQQALVATVNGREDRDALLGAILSAVPEPEMAFPSLLELAADLPPVEWLWENWIPKGMLSLLGAVSGAGKSYLALDLARRIIAGEPFPDGTPVPTPGRNVIYVDAELVPQLVNERAMAWDMDRSRLYLMLPDHLDMIDFADLDCQDRLIEMAYSLKPALVVIDSLGSISSKGENNVEDVRAILGFLNAVAADYGCGMLLIHHLRKRGPSPLGGVLSTNDFRGSGHIVAMARSVLGLSIVQTTSAVDRNGPRRLEVVKTNLACYPQPIGIAFEPLPSGGVWLRTVGTPAKARLSRPAWLTNPFSTPCSTTSSPPPDSWT